MFKIDALVSISCITLLSACGGGGSGSGGGGSSGGATASAVASDTQKAQTATYETITSKAEKTSELGGVVVRSIGTSDAESRDAIGVTGELTHNTSRIAFQPADGESVVYDNGPTDWGGNLIYGGGTKTRSALHINRLRDPEGNDYEYVRRVQNTPDHSDTTKHYAGVIGIITNPKDIPTSGRATYSGTATGMTRRTDPASDSPIGEMFNGNSNVDVDFAAGRVNVALTDLSRDDAFTPLNTIEVKNMKISGNKFYGGQVKTYAKGAEVNITGPNTKHYSGGAFFGQDAKNSIPDEVGGVVGGHGDGGSFNAEYMAD